MSGRETGKDRARRIRQQQLAARDPGDSKIKGYNWDKHFAKKRRDDTRRKKQQQRPLILVLFDALPSRWKGFIYGFLLGTLIGFVIILFVPPEWRTMIVIPQLALAIIGMIVGKALEGTTADQ